MSCDDKPDDYFLDNLEKENFIENILDQIQKMDKPEDG